MTSHERLSASGEKSRRLCIEQVKTWPTCAQHPSFSDNLASLPSEWLSRMQQFERNVG